MCAYSWQLSIVALVVVAEWANNLRSTAVPKQFREAANAKTRATWLK